MIGGPVAAVSARTRRSRGASGRGLRVALLASSPGRSGAWRSPCPPTRRTSRGRSPCSASGAPWKIGGTAVNRSSTGVRRLRRRRQLVEGAGTRAAERLLFWPEGYYRNVLAAGSGRGATRHGRAGGRKSLELILGMYRSAWRLRGDFPPLPELDNARPRVDFAPGRRKLSTFRPPGAAPPHPTYARTAPRPARAVRHDPGRRRRRDAARRRGSGLHPRCAGRRPRAGDRRAVAHAVRGRLRERTTPSARLRAWAPVGRRVLTTVTFFATRNDPQRRARPVFVASTAHVQHHPRDLRSRPRADEASSRRLHFRCRPRLGAHRCARDPSTRRARLSGVRRRIGGEWRMRRRRHRTFTSSVKTSACGWRDDVRRTASSRASCACDSGERDLLPREVLSTPPDSLLPRSSLAICAPRRWSEPPAHSRFYHRLRGRPLSRALRRSYAESIYNPTSAHYRRDALQAHLSARHRSDLLPRRGTAACFATSLRSSARVPSRSARRTRCVPARVSRSLPRAARRVVGAFARSTC